MKAFGRKLKSRLQTLLPSASTAAEPGSEPPDPWGSCSFLCNVCYGPIPTQAGVPGPWHCTQEPGYDVCDACANAGALAAHTADTDRAHTFVRLPGHPYHLQRALSAAHGCCTPSYLAAVFAAYAEWPAVGAWDPDSASYRYATYAALSSAAAVALSALARWTGRLGSASHVMMVGSNSPAYLSLDLALVSGSWVTVPMLPQSSRPVILHMLATVAPSLLVIAASAVPLWADALAPAHSQAGHPNAQDHAQDHAQGPGPPPSVARVLVFDETTPIADLATADLATADTATATADRAAALAAALNAELATLTDILAAAAADNDTPKLLDPCSPTQCRQTLRPDAPDPVFTIIPTSGSTGMPKGVVVPMAAWDATITRPFSTPDPLVAVSHSPPAHLFDKRTSYYTLGKGGRLAVYTGPPAELIHHLPIIEPTVFASTPRLWIELHAAFQDAASRPDADAAALRAEYALKLGSRIQFVTTGGGSTPPHVLAWMTDVFPASVNDGLGATEVGSIASNGAIIAGVEFVLRDLPELGYLASDTPHPRGELCVKTPEMAVRYIGADSLPLTEHGFYRTGDVVELLGDRKIRIIDRVKNFVKLSGGEFVAPEYIESHLVGATRLAPSLVVYAGSQHAYTIAIVFPPESRDQAVPFPPPKAELLAELDAVGSRNGLLAHEIPRAVVFADAPLSALDGLLTPTLKIARAAVRERFADALALAAEEHEAQLARDIQDMLHSLLGPAPAGTTPADAAAASFQLRGGDSLQAMRLVAAVEQAHGVRLSVADVATAPSVAALARLVQSARSATASSSSDSASAAAVAAAVAADLAAGYTLPPNAAHPPTPHTPATPATTAAAAVFLTGATGLVGAWVLSHLLLDDASTTVTALVRGDPARLRTLIVDVVGAVDSEAFDARVSVVLGDLAAPFLGLPEPTWRSWVTTSPFDTVVHCGAYVNAVLPYTSLAPTNVHSMPFIIELARHARTLVHVSTIGVLQGDDPASMGGYNGSKAVAERILQAAVADGVVSAVCIVRPGFVSGATTNGFCNRNDYLARLLRHCVAARATPSVDGVFEMTPVDLLAAAIARAARSAPSDPPPPPVLTLTNPSPPPLAALWTAVAAAHPDTRALSYADWKATIAAHPDSPLYPLLDAYFGGSLFPSSFLVDPHASFTVQFDAPAALAAQIAWLASEPPPT